MRCSGLESFNATVDQNNKGGRHSTARPMTRKERDGSEAREKEDCT